MFYILFIFFLSLIKIIYSENILYGQIYDVLLRAELNLRIGNPLQSMFIPINQSLPYTVIGKDKFDLAFSLSSKKIRETKLIINKEYNVIEYSDEINFSSLDNISMTIYDYYFYLTARYNNTPALNPVFGLGYQFENENFSIVHQLKKQMFIDKLIFTIDLETNLLDNKGKIYFGGTPSELIKRKNRAICKVSDSYTSWGCQLKKMIITHNNQSQNIPIYQYAHFQNCQSALILPQYLMEQITETFFFRDIIQKGLCKFIVNASWNYIACSKEVIDNDYDSKTSIKFDFDGYIFSLNLIQLFYCNNATCSSNFYSIPLQFGDQLILGSTFLNQYIVEYDYENKSISFYSDYIFPHEIEYHNNLLFSLIIIIILLLFISSIINVYLIKAKPQFIWNL